jgi:hypothetical protein
MQAADRMPRITLWLRHRRRWHRRTLGAPPTTTALLLCCVLIAVGAPTACSPGKGTETPMSPTSPPPISPSIQNGRVLLYTSRAHEELAVAVDSSGKQTVYLGTKDASGLPSVVNRAVADAQTPTSRVDIRFDNIGRPTEASTADGTLVVFDWNDDATVRVTLVSGDGSQIYSQVLSTGMSRSAVAAYPSVAGDLRTSAVTASQCRAWTALLDYVCPFNTVLAAGLPIVCAQATLVFAPLGAACGIVGTALLTVCTFWNAVAPPGGSPCDVLDISTGAPPVTPTAPAKPTAPVKLVATAQFLVDFSPSGSDLALAVAAVSILNDLSCPVTRLPICDGGGIAWDRTLLATNRSSSPVGSTIYFSPTSTEKTRQLAQLLTDGRPDGDQLTLFIFNLPFRRATCNPTYPCGTVDAGSFGSGGHGKSIGFDKTGPNGIDFAGVALSRFGLRFLSATSGAFIVEGVYAPRSH